MTRPVLARRSHTDPHSPWPENVETLCMPGLEHLKVEYCKSENSARIFGTAEYCAEFVQAVGQLRAASSGGINTLHGIPFLLGGIRNTPAIRTLAEIEHWIHIASHGSDDISATCSAFASSLRSSTILGKHEHITRLPASLTQ